MNFDVNTSISALTVFVQGLISFFSPCILPLLPVYIGYLSGGTITKDENGQPVYNRRKVIVNTLFFVIGISFAFFILGFGITAFGKFISKYQFVFSIVAGVIIILFGLYQIGVFKRSRILSSEKKLPIHLEKMTMSPITALLFGFVFSFSWTPCIGPVLTSVLLLVGSTGTFAKGTFLIVVYTLGFVIPFLAVGVFSTALLGFFGKHKNVVKYTTKIGAVIMILMGLYLVGNGIYTKVKPTFVGAPNTEVADASGRPTEETVAPEESADTQPSASAKEPTPEKEQAPARELPDIMDFVLTDQYGKTHRLSDYKGKTVFLNFWATWCPPCKAEMPDIQAIYDDFKAAGDDSVAIISIATPNIGNEKDEEYIKDFLNKKGYTYPVLMDPSGQTLYDYGINAFPTTFMINSESKVFGYVPGAIPKDFMLDIIQQTKDSVK